MKLEQRQHALAAARFMLRAQGWNLLQVEASKAFEAVACYVGQHPLVDPIVTQWYHVASQNRTEQGEFCAAWYSWQQETRHELGLSRGW